jgi:hypothetical protein
MSLAAITGSQLALCLFLVQYLLLSSMMRLGSFNASSLTGKQRQGCINALGCPLTEGRLGTLALGQVGLLAGIKVPVVIVGSLLPFGDQPEATPNSHAVRPTSELGRGQPLNKLPHRLQVEQRKARQIHRDRGLILPGAPRQIPSEWLRSTQPRRTYIGSPQADRARLPMVEFTISRGGTFCPVERS